MDDVTPEKNEAAFLRWQKERKWLMRIFWVILFLFIFIAYLTLWLIPHPEETMIKMLEKTAVGGEVTATRGEIIGLVLLSLLYVTVLIVIRLCYIKWRLGQLSKEACVFAAIVTAEDLDDGDAVRACLSMDKLLIALSDFLGQKLVALGVSSTTPANIMHVTPETIPKRAVFRAIQASADTKDFQEKLSSLATRLSDYDRAGYSAAHQFLVWLNQKTKAYREGFLERHPTLIKMARTAAPIVLPPLGVIVVDLLRQVWSALPS